MDGDGSIQVNHWRKLSLQYRLIIKLKKTISNINMLNSISSVIGGNVREVGDFVIWVENFKRKILLILKIFNKYPPLTKRLKSQLSFVYACLEHNDISIYLTSRSNKYENNIHLSTNILKIFYFKEWLSGFIESEGCFCLREASSRSKFFSISQKNEIDILLSIKLYLNSKSSIRLLNNNIFLFETYNKISLNVIVNHCKLYPLLGEKNDSFLIFIK